jgi:predicted Zn-dependent protease
LQQKIKDGLAVFEEKKNAKAVTKETGNTKKDALAAVEGGDMLDAESKVFAALKKTPRDDDLKVALARVYVKTGRVKESLAEFAAVIKKNPRHAVAFHYQGMAFMMSGDPQGAIASWQKVLELDKAYGDRFNLKGRIAIAQNMLKKDAS